jgi:hypothetical protein
MVWIVADPHGFFHPYGSWVSARSVFSVVLVVGFRITIVYRLLSGDDNDADSDSQE